MGAARRFLERIAPVVLAVAAAGVSFSALALEVGALQLRRPAGQPAYAEIPLLDSSGLDPSTIRARVATPEGYQVAGMRWLPALRSISITPQSAPDGRVVIRLDGLPSSSEVGELDLLLLVGDRVTLSLNEYRVDLRGLGREFAPAPAGSHLAGKSPPSSVAIAGAAGRPAPRGAAAPPPATPAEVLAELDEASKGQVEQALAAWTRAWSERNVEGYLGAYAADYRPPNQRMSHAEWEKQRRSRISSKQSIEVALSELQLRRRGDTVVATFRQRYRGDSLIENSRKRLVLARNQERWLIQEEVELH